MFLHICGQNACCCSSFEVCNPENGNKEISGATVEMHFFNMQCRNVLEVFQCEWFLFLSKAVYGGTAADTMTAASPIDSCYCSAARKLHLLGLALGKKVKDFSSWSAQQEIEA